MIQDSTEYNKLINTLGHASACFEKHKTTLWLLIKLIQFLHQEELKWLSIN